MGLNQSFKSVYHGSIQLGLTGHYSKIFSDSAIQKRNSFQGSHHTLLHKQCQTEPFRGINYFCFALSLNSPQPLGRVKLDASEVVRGT